MTECCSWEQFNSEFREAYRRWFDAPPTKHRLMWAKMDWEAGNTGWEAAHNAQRRAKSSVIRKKAEKP